MPLNPGYSTVIAPTLITPRQPDLTRVIACDMPCRTLVIAGKHLAMSLNAPRTRSVELTRKPAPFAAVHCGPPTHERKSVRHVDVASRPPHDRGRRAQPHAGGCRARQPLGHDRAGEKWSRLLDDHPDALMGLGQRRRLELALPGEPFDPVPGGDDPVADEWHGDRAHAGGCRARQPLGHDRAGEKWSRLLDDHPDALMGLGQRRRLELALPGEPFDPVP